MRQTCILSARPLSGNSASTGCRPLLSCTGMGQPWTLSSVHPMQFLFFAPVLLLESVPPLAATWPLFLAFWHCKSLHSPHAVQTCTQFLSMLWHKHYFRPHLCTRLLFTCTMFYVLTCQCELGITTSDVGFFSAKIPTRRTPCEKQ